VGVFDRKKSIKNDRTVLYAVHAMVLVCGVSIRLTNSGNTWETDLGNLLEASRLSLEG
jgi:hypothetical protein